MARKLSARRATSRAYVRLRRARRRSESSFSSRSRRCRRRPLPQGRAARSRSIAPVRRGGASGRQKGPAKATAGAREVRAKT
eukprot:3287064-Heterocapsa_arctica.AAC.1